jgi:heparin binding hemagglutinin HbhA
MPTQTQPKIPNPIYAAAGAGDLAIERLRKLPEHVAGLQERVNALQDELPNRMTVIGDKVTQKVAEIPSLVAELRQRVVDTDTDKLRATARRNASQFKASAQAAQEKAAAIYSELVARGQSVVDGTPAQPAKPVHAEVLLPETTAAAEVADAKAEEVLAGAATKPAKAAAKPRKND